MRKDLSGTETGACPICGASLKLLAKFANGRSVLRCVGCGLRRLLPLPDQEELDRLYGRREYYTEDLAELHDDLTAGYDRNAPIIRLYRRHLREIIAAAPPPGRLLEIGCARGVFLDLARGAGYQVAGVEVNGYAAAYARENFGLNMTAADLSRFNAEPADVVASFDVIEHVPDPAGFLRRTAELLKPGGLAVIGTPDRSSLLYRLAEGMSRVSGGRLNYPLFRFYGRGVEHLTVFGRAELSGLAARCGLAAVKTYGYGIPAGNMTAVSGIYRLGLGLLAPWPYEFALLARKAG